MPLLPEPPDATTTRPPSMYGLVALGVGSWIDGRRVVEVLRGGRWSRTRSGPSTCRRGAWWRVTSMPQNCWW